MNDYLYLAVQSWGDNVVSLRLLEELRGTAPVRVLGTRLTREIADVTGFDAFPVTVLPTDVLALYDVRVAGIQNAVRDFLRLRRAIAALAGAGTTVLFENHRRRGTHRLLQLASGGFRFAQPPAGVSAYEDRQTMLEQVLGRQIALPATRPPRASRRVVIAPGARMPFRAFPAVVMDNLLEYFTRRGSEICLVDATGDYERYRSRAQRYLARAPLAASVAEVRRADLAVVPDSLFLHLAYALAVPVLALVPPSIARAFYFAPPGLQELGLHASFEQAAHPRMLASYLDRVLGGLAPLAASPRM